MAEAKEYRVRPVLRYVVTEYTARDPDVSDEAGNRGGSSRTLGEYDNRSLAWTVADGIAKANGGFALIPMKDFRDLANGILSDMAEPYTDEVAP